MLITLVLDDHTVSSKHQITAIAATVIEFDDGVEFGFWKSGIHQGDAQQALAPRPRAGTDEGGSDSRATDAAGAGGVRG